MNKTRLYLYPVWIRIWHSVNAIMCLLLIITGISMQYSSPDNPLIRFERSVALHNAAGIILTANYFIFLIGNLITSNGKYYRIQWRGLSARLWNQMNYYSFGIFKGQQPPFPVSRERKFNPLQQFSYYIIMYFLVPLMLITGIALFFPGLVVNPLFGSHGLFVTDLLHVISGFIISVFLLVHIYFCTIGPAVSSHFKAMLTGYHESHDEA